MENTPIGWYLTDLSSTSSKCSSYALSRRELEDGTGYSSGMQPYVARDLLQFPAARPTDGLLDVVIQEVVSVLYLFLSCFRPALLI